MLSKLKRLFAKPKQQQASQERPNTPLEILMPEGSVPDEAPRFAGKFLSYLVASSQDTNTIEVHDDDRRAHSTDGELWEFLSIVAGEKQSKTLVSQCHAIMFQPSGGNAIGNLGCIQQGRLYNFAVVEHSPLPSLKWEFHRTVREIKA